MAIAARPFLAQGPAVSHFAPSVSRHLVALLSSASLFGLYFHYSLTGALAETLVTEYQFTGTMIGSLGSAYSMPNVVMPILGGMFMDRAGIPVGALLFSLLVLTGSALYAAAFIFSGFTVDRQFSLLFGAQLVLGIGGESLTVAVKSILSKWFGSDAAPGKYTGTRVWSLSLSLAVSLGFSHAGSVTCLLYVPGIASSRAEVQSCCIASLFACTISMACMIVVVSIDKHYAHPRLESRACLATKSLLPQAVSSQLHPDAEVLSAKCGYARSNRMPRELALLQCSTMSRFWLLCLAFGLASDQWAQWQVFRVGLFVEQYGYSDGAAAHLSSMPQVLMIVLLPLAGTIYGKLARPYYMVAGFLAGAALMVAAYFVLLSAAAAGLHSATYAVLAMVVLAVGASLLFAAGWPLAPYCVSAPELEGTAFGLMTGIQNATLSLTLVLAGVVLDAWRSFAALEVYAIAIGIAATVFATGLCIVWPRPGRRAVY